MRRLQHIGHIEKSIILRTENPIEEIWSYFLRFSDFNYIKNSWTNRDDCEYIYVTICIKQSYEYYKASLGLSLNTRPLLLYYSFLNLTKATLYIAQDERPPDYHGLCKENIEKDIKSIDDILDFSAEVNNGVFKKLAELLDFNINLNKRLTLADFLKNSIELNNDYSHYFKQSPSFIIPKVDSFLDGELNITFNVGFLKDDSEKINRIKTTFKNFEFEQNEMNLIFKKKIDLNTGQPGEYDKKAWDILKEYFLLSVFNDNKYHMNINDKESLLPNSLAYFGILYILSSIVRYKPDKLHNLIMDRDTSVNWMLDKICSVTERVYPNLMLNLLGNQFYKFTKHL
ncbi:hypothetical protein L21SP5_03781 [Salinivirga cyanobacteriivorans]|uniref:YaaC-like Protein n=1 Tax=Salinivirga cyanobacteriivorans TaxID=1307839 RepID=A0A0S2I4X3_9BACT|nr:YaaC family protein [Salinivirga cyanobacteriivorans]ALO17376.1 hypothetical protein L21SP5_03781 [Salinivirga cyanobacteriivorans]